MENILAELNELELLMNEKGHFFNISKQPAIKSEKIKLIAAKINLTEELIEFYNKINGLFISWFSDTDILCAGRVYIPDIKQLEKYVTKPHQTDLKEYTEYISKGYIPFDIDNINKYATFVKPKSKDDYTIIRIEPGFKEVVLSDLSITNYLSLAISTAGLYHWQNYISDKVHLNYEKYSYDGFYDILTNKLHPDLVARFIVQEKSVKQISPSDLNTFSVPDGAELRANKINLGCSAIEIRKAEIGSGQQLPADFNSFFYACNGLEIHWKSNSHTANFELLGIEKIFGGLNHSKDSL
ncbi:MAG: hypothetical protein ACRC3B_07420, partial [Bacteroidia bacterium]